MSEKNFTVVEMETLTNLVDQYKDIIECKITNAKHNAEKDRAWEELALRFNAIGCRKRTAKQLRNKYKNMKKLAQQRKGQDKVALLSTGGGSVQLESAPLGENLAVLGVLVQPIEGSLDCDADFERIIQANKNSGSAAVEMIVGLPNVDGLLNEQESQPRETLEQIGSLPRVPFKIKDEELSPSEESPTPKRVERVPLVRLGKRKPNLSEKAVESLVEGAEVRKAAVEEESKMRREEAHLRLRYEKEEHEIKMKVQNAMLRAEEARAQTEIERGQAETAKRLYYEALVKNFSKQSV